MQQLQVIEQHGIRVLTTKQIAECYETSARVIANNFNRNRSRYISEKHFICLEGQKLKNFKTNHQFDYSLKVNKLYLWTEKGALLHAKSLNTDKAWEVYDYLVDFYFRAKEKQEPVVSEILPQVIGSADWVEQALKDAAQKAYQRRIGYCQGIMRALLEHERGAVGSIMAIYDLLSDGGKKQAMDLIRKEADHE